MITYLSVIFSFVLFFTETDSAEEWSWELPKSSGIGKINEDNNGSGAALVEEESK